LQSDIATLIKAPVQFSKLSTYKERKEILGSLIKIKSGINQIHHTCVPPTVNSSILRLGCPTPTGTLCPSLPQTPTPLSSFKSLQIR
jgi:hypothetical protein